MTSRTKPTPTPPDAMLSAPGRAAQPPTSSARTLPPPASLLNELDLHVVAPDEGVASPAVACQLATEPGTARLLSEAAEVRARVFAVCYPQLVGRQAAPRDDEWRVLATRKTDGRVAGGVRLLSLPRDPAGVFDELCRLAQIEFEDPEDEPRYARAVEALFERYPDQRGFFYVGPMFVADEWRRRGLGALLGLAANAMVRLLSWRLGGALATTHDGAAKLFTRLGGYRLELDGAALPAFPCRNHGQLVELLGMDPLRSHARFDPVVEALCERLRVSRSEPS